MSCAQCQAGLCSDLKGTTGTASFVFQLSFQLTNTKIYVSVNKTVRKSLTNALKKQQKNPTYYYFLNPNSRLLYIVGVSLNAYD